MRRKLSRREFVRWMRYWEVEPWGPYRDNLHVALICRAVLTPYLKDGARLDVADFMIEDPEARATRKRVAANRGLIGMLRTLAGTPSPKGTRPKKRPAAKAKR